MTTYQPHDPLVRAVKFRLLAAGVPVQALYPGWVEYWLAQGKTVEQVVEIALNKKETGRPVKGTTS